MKLTNLSNLAVLGVVLTLSAVGCRKNPAPPITPITGLTSNRPGTGGPVTPPELPPGLPNDNRGGGGGMDVTGGIPPGPGHIGWIPDADALRQQTVYFDFDKSAVKSSEQSKLAEVANYLKGHPQAAVQVGGYCDERGTQGYNMSLGERRSLAAREDLVQLGIAPDRIDTISYGEDRPADPGHNEAAWSKNRRDDFVVLMPPKP